MRRTVGSDGRTAREPGQGLTAAAISVVARAIGYLAVLPVTFLYDDESNIQACERSDARDRSF